MEYNKKTYIRPTFMILKVESTNMLSGSGVQPKMLRGQDFENGGEYDASDTEWDLL